MSKLGRGRRVINALNELEQFTAARSSSEEMAINVITGVSVTAVVGGDDDESGMLFLRFPGGESFEVIGDRYLDLQIVEHNRYVDEGAGDSEGRRSKMASQLGEHLRRNHDLD
ncbi:hypothetical protein [Pseudorhodoferax sp. Leaf274]|uniref:hypothetical protein n=1 Tax=Pseudorhodoferax sp. Leaf274 TaxID=1736318 RepID=UPI0012E1E518|nr:hypothetical protein [Pseudorhodoferax sp. Leaf274]